MAIKRFTTIITPDEYGDNKFSHWKYYIIKNLRGLTYVYTNNAQSQSYNSSTGNFIRGPKDIKQALQLDAFTEEKVFEMIEKGDIKFYINDKEYPVFYHYLYPGATERHLFVYSEEEQTTIRERTLKIELVLNDKYLNNTPVISGEDANLGEKNKPFEIQYSVEDKDITDNVTITESLNNRQIRKVSNANNTDQTLKITSELLNSCPLGETNTIKIYAEDEKGAGTYRNYWFKRTNTPPYFVEENTDLGTVTKAPTITFTPKDDDGDKYLKAKVKINQRVVKTYDQLGNGEQVSFTLDWKDFMQLNHSRKHNLWVEVEDSSGALATLKYTFERDTKKIEIATNTAPLDIKVKLMVFNANIKLGEGATFLQYACNDFGTKNTWEKIENGVPHEFANKHEGKDVIGYKCELIKGTGESEIRSIGGSFI